MKKIKLSPSIPNNIAVDDISKNRSKIIAFPFETGYGITLAHPLRRLILGSSLGYAPISLKIEGANHEFDSIRGMHEDVSIFIINLKQIRFILNEDIKSKVINYSFIGPKDITAKDLITKEVDVVNKDVVLATLNEDAKLDFTIVIAKGLGYVRSEDIGDLAQEDSIALDAFFTPVKHVNYDISSVLVDDSLNHEKITFDIETDGQISPINVFINGLEIMYKQLTVFNDILNVEVNATSIKKHISDTKLEVYLKPIESLRLSARSHNSLMRSDIKYVGDLVLMNKNDIKDIKNLGKKSFDEISKCLEGLGSNQDFKINESMKNNLIKKLNQLKKGK